MRKRLIAIPRGIAISQNLSSSGGTMKKYRLVEYATHLSWDLHIAINLAGKFSSKFAFFSPLDGRGGLQPWKKNVQAAFDEEAKIANSGVNIVQCTPTQSWLHCSEEKILCIVVHPIFILD